MLAAEVDNFQLGLPTEESGLTANPCQTCGACCASFRVSFYWAEADDAPGGIAPAQFTEAVSPQLCCMKGTACKPVRCMARSRRANFIVIDWRRLPIERGGSE